MKGIFFSFASIFSSIRKLQRPRWYLFPKAGRHIHSLFEVIVYIAILIFCKGVFEDFNKVPHYIVSINAERLDNYRYLSKSSQNDSVYYLHYQIANLKLQIPMVSSEYEESENIEGVYSGDVRNDSFEIKCKKVSVVAPFLYEKSDQIRLSSSLSPYWQSIFYFASRNSGYQSVPSNQLSGDVYKRKFYELRDTFIRKVRRTIPDSLSDIVKNFYRFKVSSNILDDGNLRNLEKGSQQEEETNKQYLCYAQNRGIEMIEAKECEYVELSLGNNRSDESAHFYLKKDSTKNNQRHVAIERPKWLDRHDISRGWYKIFLNSSTIDSLELTIDFVGATDFYPMKIEPDERGSNYIKYSDVEKILQIQREGLDLYAQFRDLENQQTVRCFFVTAIISGLLIALLTFVITWVYRGLKAIGRHTVLKK